MTHPDHDLMESVAADSDPAITIPASPPRRDSTEDADSTLTRKRPRLDGSGTSIRAMSTDPVSPSSATASVENHHEQTQQQVEMTIRSQPPSSSQPDDSMDSANAPPDVPLQTKDVSPPIVTSTEDDTVGSPPIVIIDDDDDQDQALEGAQDPTGYNNSAPGYVQIEMDAESYFQQFPFTQHGNYTQAVRSLANHIHGANPIDSTVLPLVEQWLLALPDPLTHLDSFYMDKPLFWEEFANLVNKVLLRRYRWINSLLSGDQDIDTSRYPFGDHFCDEGQSEDDIFYMFLSAYMKLCSYLFQADAESIRITRSDDEYTQPLLSYKHLRHIHTIFRQEKSPVFHLLSKEYAVNTDRIGMRLVHSFLKVGGAQSLLRLADIAYHEVPTITQNWIAAWTPQILTILGSVLSHSRIPEDAVEPLRFNRDVLHFFRKYSEDLQIPSKATDAGVTRDLVIHFSGLLTELCQWDDDLAAELVEQFLDFQDAESPTTTGPSDVAENGPFSDAYRQDPASFPALVMNAWRFKLLRKYIVKGRMELRVMSISAMDTALVEIYREFNAIDPSGQHPVMQYLADFLLHGRVIDYIISVDSHPQLIQRSGNVVGFLVVTHRYSTKQTDAIWNTVSSPDPRVVAATMTMFRGIVGLMDTVDQLYLCTKLFDLAIDAYTVDILRFLRELTIKLQEKYVDWKNTDPKSRPWNVCIRMLQDTPLSRETTKLTASLHAEASEQLRLISGYVNGLERAQIYQDCAAHVASSSAKATGSLRAISILAYTSTFGDATFFKEHPDVPRQILEETMKFVETESQEAIYGQQMQALQYRLELLSLLITRASETVVPELYQDIWDHLVGKRALTNQARDLAWTQFSDAVRIKPDNDFCKQLISIYVPSLEPWYYTPGLYDFVAKYGFRTSRRLVPTNEGEKELLQIRGADLLWSIVLSAPKGSIENQAARLLATRYVEVQDELDVSLEEVEEAHVALVERCMKELKSAYKILRGKAPSQAAANDDMEIVVSDEARDQNEIRIGRILLLEKLLLASIRKKPEFNRSRRADSKVEPIEADLPFGDAIEIKYQSGNDKTSVQMGAEHTVRDLHRRLCHATGYTKINLFANGQRLNVNERGDQKLLDMNLGGLLLVQKAPGSETTRPILETTGGCSVFEVNLLEHFEELFDCMDSDDHISQLLFDFLSSFPPRDRFAGSVISGEATSEQLFPPGKFYQAKYAVQALQCKLREQVRSSSLNETFLVRAVQLLDQALLNPSLISDSVSGQHELQLAAALINVFLEFLKERPSLETSSDYFSNSSQLSSRLVKIMITALDSENDQTQVVCNSYALILEASLHCRGIWEAFMSNSEIPAIHQILLLADPRKSLREHVTQSIMSICGGDLPSTCPLNKAEIAARYWAIVSAVLPEAIQYPDRSVQLFGLAEHVFRCNDENSRDEESLRSSFATWSDLLLNHKHKEFVGRDETDFVVLGFTKLLLCCVPSLKSFKKSLNAAPLMKHVFTKFLFVPSRTEVHDQAHQPAPLPVLDSQTRKELYDLLLALAEDRTSYETLLDLTGEVENDELETSFAVDRTNEIRSRTGYVGLHNPRAICYMNSLLTQLFMNVDFRKFILGLNIAETSSQRLLTETQKLFTQMQNSYRKSTDPRDFAACVKNPDQRPIDINIQMDADEFYNLLFDQWEGQMLSADVKQRFRSFYGGHTVNQIKSKECEHVSERSEPFFVVQCDVQGKANLQESLQAFVEGDVMEGDNKYKCESCGGKFVDAVKRTCLKDVPDNLIFHLKRFDFDLSELRRAKVNDYFEFPTLIDVSPYNIEHLSDTSKPRKEDIFELVGVLVHQGTSENGHYYSYIRERPCPPGAANNWVEFNDREVDKFDQTTIPYHTFGGPYDDQFRQQKQFSAYMLFYQRQVAIEKDRAEYMASPQSESPKVPVPESLAQDVDIDNELFIREYSLFDPYHSKFVRQMLTTLRSVNHGVCSETHEQETRALHIVLQHLCHIVCRLRTVENFEEIMLQLRKAVFSCPACCNIALNWLASDDSALVNLFLRCLHAKIRAQTRAFLVDSLKFLRGKDPVLYGVESMDADMEMGASTPVEGVLSGIIDRLRLVAEESYIGSRGWDDLYLTLCQINEIGHLETAIILDHGILEFCLSILALHAHHRLREEMSDIWRVIDKKRNIYNRMIELIYNLLTSIDAQLPELRQGRRQDIPEQEDFPLSRKEKHLLSLWHEENNAVAVLDRMIEQFDRTKTENFFPGDVLQWMMLSPEAKSHQMLYLTVIEGITQLSHPHCDPYIRAALPFCEACPNIEYIERVIDAVTKVASQVREMGGESVIQFFSGLMNAHNEHVFQARQPHFFYEHCIMASRKYAIPLLFFEDDLVRKVTQTFLQELFAHTRVNEVVLPETLARKYFQIRYLASQMMHKIGQEHENGTSRAYMSPMISTCQTLVQVLFLLSSSEDPMLDEYKDINDNALIHRYHVEVESRLRHWPQDESTPVSTGDAYEHSDYGSESDEGPDLLDI